LAEEQQPTGGAGRPALDTIGGVLGLIVFLVGVGLLVSVFLRATKLYGEIGPAIDAARAGSQAAPAPGPTHPAQQGPAAASQGGKPLASIGAEFGLKLVWLVVQGLLAALVAAMGAKLAGAHRGKRT